MMDNEVLYVYRDGVYRDDGEVLVRFECNRRLEGEYRKNKASEVIDYIKTSTYTKRREEPPHLLSLENGVLDLQTMALAPPSPDFMFFQKIPVFYDPEADCPRIRKFLEEISGRVEDVTVLEEVIGYCLFRGYPIQKALMLVGRGANGKSTLLALIKALLGHENVSGRSLQDLINNRFAPADLFGKLANMYADLPDSAVKSTGMFKMLTGGDLISAEEKFVTPFSFVNYAKLLFSANKVPEAYDDTDAFFRRWIILVFPNFFNGDGCDPNLLEKITTPEELSGLLNLALAGLKRLLANQQFSHSQTTEAIREDYVRKSSPIGAFVMDLLEVDSDAFIIKQELYNAFTKYCREFSLPAVTRDTFFKNLPQYISVIDVRPQLGKSRPTAFKGIRFNGDASTVSSLSRAFYTLNSRRADFNGGEWDKWVIRNVGSEYIKIEKPLDRVDSLDEERQTKLGEEKPVSKKSTKSRREAGSEPTIIIGQVDPRQIKNISKLNLSRIGECANCCVRSCRLTHAVETDDGKNVHVCEGCAEKLEAERQK